MIGSNDIFRWSLLLFFPRWTPCRGSSLELRLILKSIEKFELFASNGQLVRKTDGVPCWRFRWAEGDLVQTNSWSIPWRWREEGEAWWIQGQARPCEGDWEDRKLDDKEAGLRYRNALEGSTRVHVLRRTRIQTEVLKTEASPGFLFIPLQRAQHPLSLHLSGLWFRPKGVGPWNPPLKRNPISDLLRSEIHILEGSKTWLEAELGVQVRRGSWIGWLVASKSATNRANSETSIYCQIQFLNLNLNFFV